MFAESSSNKVLSVYWETGFVRLLFFTAAPRTHRTVVAATHEMWLFRKSKFKFQLAKMKKIFPLLEKLHQPYGKVFFIK